MASIESVDTTRREIFIRIHADDGFDEHLAMIRTVAIVTNQTGGYAIVIDGRSLNAVPSFPEITRLAAEAWRLRSPIPDDIVILAPRLGVLFGKARQLITILEQTGLSAAMFTDMAECRTWLDARQTRAIRDTTGADSRI